MHAVTELLDVPVAPHTGMGSFASLRMTTRLRGGGTQEMKAFWVTIRMGRTDILDAEVEDEMIQVWLDGRFEHLISLFEGRGTVDITRVDPLRIDVALNFTVQGDSVADVMGRFKADFEVLAPQTQAIEIAATRPYKLYFPTVAGEQFPVFIRVDPDSGKPLYTED